MYEIYVYLVSLHQFFPVGETHVNAQKLGERAKRGRYIFFLDFPYCIMLMIMRLSQNAHLCRFVKQRATMKKFPMLVIDLKSVCF